MLCKKKAPLYDPPVPLLGIYLERSRILKEVCTSIFITAVITLARIWKQLECPLTEEWIKKTWCIHAVEY